MPKLFPALPHEYKTVRNADTIRNDSFCIIVAVKFLLIFFRFVRTNVRILSMFVLCKLIRDDEFFFGSPVFTSVSTILSLIFFKHQTS